MKGVSIADLEQQILRLLTKYDSLTRADLVLELRGLDESIISTALEDLQRNSRIIVEEDKEGVKTIKKAAGFFTSIGHYSTSSSF